MEFGEKVKSECKQEREGDFRFHWSTNCCLILINKSVNSAKHGCSKEDTEKERK